MGIEHLQKFDITGEQGDQIASPVALQLGRCQLSQRAKNTIPDDCQQLKGDVMAAGLFSISKDRPGHRTDEHHQRAGGK